MKIFDTAAVIAVLEELDRPDLIDKMLMLGHDLMIPKYIADVELSSAKVKRRLGEMVESGKIKILEETPEAEMLEFWRDFPKVGSGESHVMVAYRKAVNANQAAYCILDDRRARAHAARNNVEYTGLIGLFGLLKKRGILTAREIDEIIAALRNTNFRLPKSFSV